MRQIISPVPIIVFVMISACSSVLPVQMKKSRMAASLTIAALLMAASARGCWRPVHPWERGWAGSVLKAFRRAPKPADQFRACYTC
jgi:hypothetical protein